MERIQGRTNVSPPPWIYYSVYLPERRRVIVQVPSTLYASNDNFSFLERNIREIIPQETIKERGIIAEIFEPFTGLYGLFRL